MLGVINGKVLDNDRRDMVNAEKGSERLILSHGRIKPISFDWKLWKHYNCVFRITISEGETEEISF